MVVDGLGVLGAGRLDDVLHHPVQVEPPALGRPLAAGSISQGRLTELDRAVERGDEPRRKALGLRVGNRREAIGDELRGRQACCAGRG